MEELMSLCGRGALGVAGCCDLLEGSSGGFGGLEEGNV